MPAKSELPSDESRVGKARYLIIVARDQPDLWRHLTQNTGEYEGIEFVLDRRHGGRVRWAQMRALQERGTDRRRPLGVDEDLHHRAFVIVPGHEGSEGD